MMMGQKKGGMVGGGGDVHLPLYATSLFLLDVNVSATGYRAHHDVQVPAISLTAMKMLFWKKTKEWRKKKKTDFTDVCAGQGADV